MGESRRGVEGAVFGAFVIIARAFDDARVLVLVADATATAPDPSPKEGLEGETGLLPTRTPPLPPASIAPLAFLSQDLSSSAAG